MIEGGGKLQNQTLKEFFVGFALFLALISWWE